MPVVKVLGQVFYRELGRKLREVRVQAGLKQNAVGVLIGFKPGSGQAYLSRLEKGNVHGVELDMIVRYLQVCKAPIGKFTLELAQSGAFGEAEQGLAVVQDKTKDEEARRTKAKLLHEKRWLREVQDAETVGKLWTEVFAAIRPLFPPGRTVLIEPYREGVRLFYRAWKQVVRGTTRLDTALQVEMAFDRIEQVGVQKGNLLPSAVHKMREMLFERLMAMTPQGGKT
jgi:transcriptional regulator with XRE-family HTH domain